MSDDSLDTAVGSATDALVLRIRAAGAGARVEAEAQVAAADFFLPQEGRLDDRTRVALTALLARLVEGIQTEIREYGVRQLVARGETTLADALAASTASPVDRLARAGLLRDSALAGELIARVRMEILGAALPIRALADPGQPSLTNRCIQHADRVLASSAMAMSIAEGRRRDQKGAGHLALAELPAEVHRMLVWAVAAALRESSCVPDDALPQLDRALSDAAQRCLAAYDEGDRLEAATSRFAAALDASPQELDALLLETLGDQRIVVFTGLLAHALSTSFDAARALVLDPCGERFWLALRSLGLHRETIAQIGYALCEADPRRDLESFADTLDVIMALGPAQARDAIEPVGLDPQYRAAITALRRAETPAWA